MYQELINKFYMVNYRDFVSMVLRKNRGKENQPDHNNRIYEYRSLLNNLKAEKLELNRVLTQR